MNTGNNSKQIESSSKGGDFNALFSDEIARYANMIYQAGVGHSHLSTPEGHVDPSAVQPINETGRIEQLEPSVPYGLQRTSPISEGNRSIHPITNPFDLSQAAVPYSHPEFAHLGLPVEEQQMAPNYYFLSSSYAANMKQKIDPTTSRWNVDNIRRDFPILSQKVNGRNLVWFDSAATTQKPSHVINSLVSYYEKINSNIHRGAHSLARQATDAYENARTKVQHFLGAASSDEIVFLRGATEAINLVAQSYGRKYITAGDEILITKLEHHANIVPWQMLAEETGALLRVAPINERGEVLLDEYEKLLTARTRMVSISHASNALGSVVPVEEMIKMARRFPTRILVDGAQAVPHFRVNVQNLDADFYVFSGHKLFAPTGIGILYGKQDILNQMPPWQGGGHMIKDVTFERTTYNVIPFKFEAGTGNIADAIGLGAAIDYLEQIGFEAAAAYENFLLKYATDCLRHVPGLQIIGTAAHKVPVISFVMKDFTPEEIGRRLDQEGIALRAGHHCAQPVLRHFGLEATVRPSFTFFNTTQEIDLMASVLQSITRSHIWNGFGTLGPGTYQVH